MLWLRVMCMGWRASRRSCMLERFFSALNVMEFLRIVTLCLCDDGIMMEGERNKERAGDIETSRFAMRYEQSYCLRVA